MSGLYNCTSRRQPSASKARARSNRLSEVRPADEGDTGAAPVGGSAVIPTIVRTPRGGPQRARRSGRSWGGLAGPPDDREAGVREIWPGWVKYGPRAADNWAVQADRRKGVGDGAPPTATGSADGGAARASAPAPGGWHRRTGRLPAAVTPAPVRPPHRTARTPPRPTGGSGPATDPAAGPHPVLPAVANPPAAAPVSNRRSPLSLRLEFPAPLRIHVPGTPRPGRRGRESPPPA